MQNSKPPQTEATPRRPIGLIEVLDMLPETELKVLAERVGVRLDPRKRITLATQLARGLVALPVARDPSRLNPPQAELVRRVAEAGGALLVPELPVAARSLIACGLLFARPVAGQIELLVPIAYLVQMERWQGEHARGVRALLSQTAPEVAAAIASHYLGKSATHPTCLALEPAFRALRNPDYVRRAVSDLVPDERKLLMAVEELGGEVDTEELLELEKEPLRLRGAGGATQSRRGVGFAFGAARVLDPASPQPACHSRRSFQYPG